MLVRHGYGALVVDRRGELDVVAKKFSQLRLRRPVVDKPDALGHSKISRDGVALGEVSFPTRPHFYDRSTADGIPYWKIAVLHGRDVLYVVEERAPGRPPLVTDVGVRLPAHLTASGRAISD